MNRICSARFLIAVVTFVFLAFSLPGCGGRGVSKGNFDKINNGMSEAEVDGILGKGEEQASAGVNLPGQPLNIPGGVNVSLPGISASVKVKKWHEGDRSITVTYSDGKVVSKTQSGL